MNVTHLECALCGLEHEARRLLNLCRACGKPLLVRYDLDRAKVTLTKESLAARRADLWRYREVLPVDADDNIVSFGEGWTPLLHVAKARQESRYSRALHQGRVAEPDAEFQGARHGDGRFDGEGVGRNEARRSVGRKRRRRTGRLRRARGAAVLHLHAARHAASERRRVPTDRRARDADGWSHHRLRRRGSAPERRRKAGLTFRL